MRIIVQCCACGKIKTKKGWAKNPPPKEAEVSHGYCPRCLEQALVKNEK